MWPFIWPEIVEVVGSLCTHIIDDGIKVLSLGSATYSGYLGFTVNKNNIYVVVDVVIGNSNRFV